MKTENIIAEKSKALAVRIINLYKYLCDEKKAFVLSKQLLRSGTSIGAESECAIGKKDFLSKIYMLELKSKVEGLFGLNSGETKTTFLIDQFTNKTKETAENG